MPGTVPPWWRPAMVYWPILSAFAVHRRVPDLVLAHTHGFAVVVVEEGDPGACPQCGRAISAPKTASGTRTVHVPPPFLPLLQKHLLEHTAAGPTGLLFPGDRTDHMSVRYLMDRYRPARKAAGRPDLTIHHLRHTALTIAGQHDATAAELQARAGHASQAAMAFSQHATLDRDKRLAEAIGDSYMRCAGAQDQSWSLSISEA